MKKLVMLFGILMVVLSLNSCIVANAPSTKDAIKVPVGDEVQFEVRTLGGITVWKLNDKKVDLGAHYTFIAKEVGKYKLTAFNGVRLTWEIEVYKTTGEYYEDADGDGFGNPNSTIEAETQPEGYVTNTEDCDDTDEEINPNKTEICADGVGSYCNDGKVVPCPKDTPLVSASDVESGKTNIEVTWTAVEGATSYKVYMAEEEDGAYEEVATGITGTSYTYVEDWQDVIAAVGPTPRMAPDAGKTERKAFGELLVAYRLKIAPYIHSFKKEKRFKVQACKGTECGELSDYDQGQAEYIHTKEFSDISEVLINVVGYPLLICLADSPPGAEALSWPGKIVPSALGLDGQVDGTVDLDAYVHVLYQGYKEGHLPSRIMEMNGEIGGQQDLLQSALYGVVEVSGDVEITGSVNAKTHLWSYIGGTKKGAKNKGTIDVTYKNATYQFPLPVQPGE